MKARLLLLEDEKNVASTLVERLESEGFMISWAANVADASLEIAQCKFDLALLDVGLPDGSGFQVAETLRKNQPSTAIIFLTAFGDPEHRIHGLELGAEDYIVKPFHFRELLLRIQNGLKRAYYLKGAGNDVQLGKAIVHFAKYQAERDGEVQTLTQKECSLLKFLFDRSGRVVSRDEILNHVWSADEFPTPRTVDNFIMRLRRLVEDNPETPVIIKSVRGIGYQLENPKGMS